jgi:hypothetical protein
MIISHFYPVTTEWFVDEMSFDLDFVRAGAFILIVVQN